MRRRRTANNNAMKYDDGQASSLSIPGRSGEGTGKSSRQLIRERLLQRMDERLARCRRLALCAPGGAGKTTLMQQYAARFRGYASWLTLEAGRLYLHDLACRLLEKVQLPAAPPDGVAANAVLLDAGHDEAALAAIVLDAMARRGRTEDACLLLLDNVQLVADQPEACAFLERILKHLPPTWRCVLASRMPMERLARGLALGVDVIDAEEIRFTRSEQHAYFRELHGMHLSPRQLHALDTKVQGWALALPLFVTLNTGDLSLGQDQDMAVLAERLFRILLSGLDVRASLSLYLFALIEEFLPDELRPAGALGRSARALLDGLLEKGVLQIAGLAGYAHSPMRLHPLFREYLLDQAALRMSRVDRQRCRIAAARCLARRGDALAAAACYLEAGAFGKAAQLLVQAGPGALQRGRHQAVGELTGKLPDRVLKRDPWLWLLHESARNLQRAARDTRSIQALIERFAREGERRGELLAIAELLVRRGEILGRLDACTRDLVRRADRLLEEIGAELDASTRAKVEALIGISHVFIPYGQERAYARLNDAVTSARALGLVNLQARAGAFMALFHMRTGDLEHALLDLEGVHGLLNRPALSSDNRALIHGCVANALFLGGKFTALREHLDGLPVGSMETSAMGELLGSYFLRWRIRLMAAQGEWEKAGQLVERGLRDVKVRNNPYVEGMLLEDAAMLRALEGDASALRLLEQSEALLRREGHRYDHHHWVYHLIASGIVYLQLGRTQRAVPVLEEASRLAQEAGKRIQYLSAQAYLALAWYRLGDEAACAACFGRFAGELARQPKARVYYGWHPVLKALFAWAARAPRTRVLAERMLREQWDETLLEGEVVPLLHLNLLGEFRLEQKRRRVAGASDVTPQQRMLLVLLATQRSHRLPVTEIQALFWPNVPEEKARGNLDVMLSRLRQALGKRLIDGKASRYLRLRNGILSLEGCVVDADRFEGKVRQGLEHVSSGRRWEGALSLEEAVRLYRGAYASGMDALYQVLDRRAFLEKRYAEAVHALAEFRVSSGRVDQARELLQQALEYCGDADVLYRCLYALLAETGAHVQAAKLLERYRAMLQESGLSPQEVDALVDEVLTTRAGDPTGCG